MTGWPSDLPIRSEMARAVKSILPPGAKGTTRVMARVGQLSAKAAEQAKASAATAAFLVTLRMSCLLLWNRILQSTNHSVHWIIFIKQFLKVIDGHQFSGPEILRSS